MIVKYVTKPEAIKRSKLATAKLNYVVSYYEQINVSAFILKNFFALFGELNQQVINLFKFRLIQLLKDNDYTALESYLKRFEEKGYICPKWVKN